MHMILTIYVLNFSMIYILYKCCVYIKYQSLDTSSDQFIYGGEENYYEWSDYGCLQISLQ